MPESYDHSIQKFIDYIKFQKRYSRHTITSYQFDLGVFFKFLETEFGSPQLEAIKPSFVRSWLAGLKEEGLSSRSINRKISSLKSFFKYQLRQQTVKTSPLATIISPKAGKRLPQFVDKRDIETLFTQVEFPDDWTGRTERMILDILYNTGMRKSELIGLQDHHLDLSNSALKVLGKGNKERIIPVSNDFSKQVRHYISDKKKQFENTDPSLLVNEKGKKLDPRYVYGVVRKYLSLITTIDRKSPHILRHSFATHLTNNGADLNAVKELLGHSSLAATQVYTHNNIEKLKDIFKKAHPKG